MLCSDHEHGITKIQRYHRLTVVRGGLYTCNFNPQSFSTIRHKPRTCVIVIILNVTAVLVFYSSVKVYKMTTQMSNLSCLLYDPHDARFENREVPTITDPYDVIIRIVYVGVCGSDVSHPD